MKLGGWGGGARRQTVQNRGGIIFHETATRGSCRWVSEPNYNDRVRKIIFPNIECASAKRLNHSMLMKDALYCLLHAATCVLLLLSSHHIRCRSACLDFTCEVDTYVRSISFMCSPRSDTLCHRQPIFVCSQTKHMAANLPKINVNSIKMRPRICGRPADAHRLAHIRCKQLRRVEFCFARSALCG